MEHKIATLEVFLDTESTQSSGTKRVGPKQYQIRLHPNQDLGDGSGQFTLKTVKDFQTTFAHELGHFVAIVTRDETHDPVNNFLFQMTGDSSTILPAEKKAWELAHVILPDYDKENEKRSLQTYEERAWKQIPTDDVSKDRLRAMYWKAESDKQNRKARVWMWSVLAALFGAYWFAGLLNMGIR